MSTKNKITTILFMAGLVLCDVVLAGGRGISTIPPPVIVKAKVDVTENVLIISGRNFGENPPTVLLAEEALPVKRFSAHEVVASLPRGLAQATYGITVISNHARSQAVSGPFSVAISGSGRK